MRTSVNRLRDLRFILRHKEVKLKKQRGRDRNNEYRNQVDALRWAISELEIKYHEQIKAHGSCRTTGN